MLQVFNAARVILSCLYDRVNNGESTDSLAE
jgi:hypothetical protein